MSQYREPASADITISTDAARVIREVIDILDASRHTFKSKQIARARQLLDALLRAQQQAISTPEYQKS